MFPHPIIIFSDKGKSGTVTNVQGLYDDLVWTGQTLNMVFDYSGISADYLDITLNGWRPENAGPLDAGIVAVLNGRQLEVNLIEKSMLRFTVPQELLLKSGNALDLVTPTFIPRDLDQTKSDTRILGLDIRDIVLR